MESKRRIAGSGHTTLTFSAATNTWRWPVEQHTGETVVRFADAEQAKHTGGMIALYPRQDFVDQLVVPGGEPPEDLHLTLVFLGEDIGDMPTADLAPALGQLADMFSIISARVFGAAIFNPDGHQERTPAAVYLVGDSPELVRIHVEAIEIASRLFNMPDQSEPFFAHITAIYNGDPGLLGFTGPVIFDRLGLALAGNITYFPLAGA